MNLIMRQAFNNQGAKRSLSINTPDPEQFWIEEDFVFEGTRCTRYLWPKDRQMVFRRINRATEQVICPAFSLNRINNVIAHMRGAIRAHQRPCYLHVINILGYPDLVALFTHNEKCIPVTDFYLRIRRQG